MTVKVVKNKRFSFCKTGDGFLSLRMKKIEVFLTAVDFLRLFCYN